MSNNNSKSPPRYERGDRGLLRGLQNKPELNGCLVEFLKVLPDYRYKAKVLRAPTRVNQLDSPYENMGKVLSIKELNLMQCELNWERVVTTTSNEEGVECRNLGGSVAYSDTAMYVFGGMQQLEPDSDDDDEEDQIMISPSVSDVWSFNFKEQKWRCHWWLGLPGPVEGGYQLGDADFSRTPPHPSEGALLIYTDPSTKEDVLFFYSSKQPDPPQGEAAPAIDPDHDKTDCLWIFRFHANLPSNQDLGYWQSIPTTGRKPASFLTGILLKYNYSGRTCARSTVLVPS